VSRRVACPEKGHVWQVEDTCTTRDGAAAAFTVSWQFAPGTSIRRMDDRAFLAERAGVRLHIALSGSWGEVTLTDGLVSPAFRLRARGPLLKLAAGAGAHSSSPFVTTFSLVEHG
jgi:hypothetical protein